MLCEIRAERISPSSSSSGTRPQTQTNTLPHSDSSLQRREWKLESITAYIEAQAGNPLVDMVYYDLSNLGYDCGGGVAAIGAITGGDSDDDYDYNDAAAGRGSMIGGFLSSPVFGGDSVDEEDQTDEDTEQDSTKIVPDSIRMMHAAAAAAAAGGGGGVVSKTEQGATAPSNCCNGAATAETNATFEQRNPYDPNWCSGSPTPMVNRQYKMTDTTPHPPALPSRPTVQRPALSRAGSLASTSCSSMSMSSVGSSIYQQQPSTPAITTPGTTTSSSLKNQNKPPAVVRRDLHVTFSTVTIRKIPHRLTYSKEEKLATWYNVQEFQSIRQSAIKLARSIESKTAAKNNGEGGATGRETTIASSQKTRGLERLGKAAIKKLSARRRVLYSELKVLRELGWMGKEKSHAVLDDLAELFRGYTKSSAQEARAIGQLDEKVAYKCYHDDLIAARRHLDGGDENEDENADLNHNGDRNGIMMRRSPKSSPKTSGHRNKSRMIEPPRPHHHHYHHRQHHQHQHHKTKPDVVERQSSSSSSPSSSLSSPSEDNNVENNNSTKSYWDIVPSLFFG
mmetsp:Transcript_22681/g.53681  ORF Transcript_22681/g.53681 Transcript_22681/m.53681 type:complete len:565 (+) Transcript_22681:53-1747(+)